jgi:S-formylglutathione hydrolase FrmB
MHDTKKGSHTMKNIFSNLAGAGFALLLQVTSAHAFLPTLPAQTQDSNGIHLVSWSEVDLDGTGPNAPNPRLLDAVVTTAAIFQNGDSIPISVRILIPADYQTNPSRHYPVLFLLHGGTGTFVDWSQSGDGAGQVQSIVDNYAVVNNVNVPLDVIVVMPEGGRTSWYADWHGATDGGFTPLWETFHVAQLVPWIDVNFRTTGTRAGRAIAGWAVSALSSMQATIPRYFPR